MRGSWPRALASDEISPVHPGVVIARKYRLIRRLAEGDQHALVFLRRQLAGQHVEDEDADEAGEHRECATQDQHSRAQRPLQQLLIAVLQAIEQLFAQLVGATVLLAVAQQARAHHR